MQKQKSHPEAVPADSLAIDSLFIAADGLFQALRHDPAVRKPIETAIVPSESSYGIYGLSEVLELPDLGGNRVRLSRSRQADPSDPTRIKESAEPAYTSPLDIAVFDQMGERRHQIMLQDAFETPSGESVPARAVDVLASGSIENMKLSSDVASTLTTEMRQLTRQVLSDQP